MAEVDLSSRIDAIAARSKAKSAQQDEIDAAAAQAKVGQVEARRAAMREAMPEIAGVVDQIRDVFGDVEVLVAEEGGKRVVAEKRLKQLGLYRGYSSQ
jgi:hypothetical protein